MAVEFQILVALVRPCFDRSICEEKVGERREQRVPLTKKKHAARACLQEALRLLCEMHDSRGTAGRGDEAVCIDRVDMYSACMQSMTTTCRSPNMPL